MPWYHVTMERLMQTTVVIEAATLWEGYAAAEAVDLSAATWEEVITTTEGMRHVDAPPPETAD